MLTMAGNFTVKEMTTEKECNRMAICDCANKVCLIHQNEYFRKIEHSAAIAENRRILLEVEEHVNDSRNLTSMDKLIIKRILDSLRIDGDE